MSFRTKGTVGPVYRPGGEPIDIKPSLDVTKAEDAILASKKQPVPSHAISNKIIFPKRPTYGTAGRRITLRTNYFHLIPTAGQRVYRYVVQFDPEATTSRKERRLFNLLFEDPIFAAVKESIATDYRSIVISPEELPLDADARKFVITYYDADEATPRANAAKHTACIQITGALDVADMMQYLNSTARDASYDRLEEMTQALNIVIARHANTTLGTVSLSGNKFFPTTGGLEEFIDLSGGVIAIRGYYTSVRTATLRVLLNLNVCTSAFYQSTQLSDLMMKQWNICGRKWDGVESFIKKLRVETTYLKDKSGQIVRKFKNVSGFAQPPQKAFATLREVKFDSEYGEISVAAFFKKKHGIILQNPDVPAVNVGTRDRQCYLPPELCLVSAGQVMKKRLSENQTNMMMKFANRSPPDNARQIVGTGLKVVGIKEGGGGALAAFGIKATPRMIAVPGRVLSPPSVMYHTKRLSLCADGTWYIVSRDRFSASVRFSASARLAKWSYLKITYDGGPIGRSFDPQLPVALTNFKNVLQSFGMIVPAPTPPGGFGVSLLRNPSDEVNAGRLSAEFEKAKEAEVRFLLVILRDTNKMTYARVKRLGDAVFGIHTICVVGDSFVKNSPAYMANVALKANLKMGGRNQELGPGGLGFVGEGRTMIVGIDVTHPSPESAEGAPSIAGVVASVDAKLAHWPASIRIQEGRKEMVDGLEDMVVERLKLWRQKNNQLPAKVLVYRDGVSEGQYGTVLAEEVPCIKKAFKRIYPTNAPQPKLSIVVVGKRHHTRFYPVKENETDRTGNPSHGTVVDRGVTYDRKWDFFLQAHHSLKGTARPAHYVVLLNEMGLGVDVLEQLTHNMCYLFGRSTVPVSICPPAYYADILCERGRCYIHEVYNAERTVKTLDKDQIKIAKAEIFKKAMASWGEGVHGNLKDTMFYL